MVKFKVPSEFRISGMTYKVVMDPKLGSFEGKYGSTDHFRREMRIDATQTEEDMRNTFLHEAIHAGDVLYRSHLKEDQVHQMTNALNEIIQQLEVEE